MCMGLEAYTGEVRETGKNKQVDGGKAPPIGANAEAVSLKLIRLKDGREIYVSSAQAERRESA